MLLQAATPPFPGAGEAAALASALAWGCASVLYARAFRVGTALDAVWFKNAVSATVLGLVARLIGPTLGGGAVAPAEAGWLAGSGLAAVCVGDFLYFLAIAHIGVARTVILTQATPALTALVAWPLYGQQLAAAQWVGVLLVCLGGSLAESRRVARRPADRLGFLAALACVAAWTLGNLLTHLGMERTGPVSAGALRVGAAAAGFALVFLLRGQLVPRLRALGDPRMWRAYGLPTLIGTVLGMSFYTAGVKWAPLGIASALASALPLFTVPLAIWVLGERPGLRGWGGALLVVAGVAMIGMAGDAVVHGAG